MNNRGSRRNFKRRGRPYDLLWRKSISLKFPGMAKWFIYLAINFDAQNAERKCLMVMTRHDNYSMPVARIRGKDFDGSLAAEAKARPRHPGAGDAPGGERV